MWYLCLLFCGINFSALLLGGLSTNKGVRSNWYLNLKKAPWTPPGWVFGFAWTTIMLAFGYFMANAWLLIDNTKTLLLLYIVQWILNVAWNPIFFSYHYVQTGLLIIVLLAGIVLWIILHTMSDLHAICFFALPYFVWLILATSLNAYVVLKNRAV